MREWIIETTLHLYSLLLPFAQWAFLLALVVLLPMAIFKSTRALAGSLLLGVSYLFGLTTWLFGAGIAFASYGWLGLFIGLILFGVGVVPVGIAGSYFKLDQTEIAISLIAMSVITYGARMLAGYFIVKSEE